MEYGDVIYRQAAIDVIDEIESEVADGDGFQYEKWRQYLCELPSVQPEQPEIIRCKYCKHRIENEHYIGYAECFDGFCKHWAKEDE